MHAAKEVASELAFPSHSAATKPAWGANKNGTDEVPNTCQLIVLGLVRYLSNATLAAVAQSKTHRFCIVLQVA